MADPVIENGYRAQVVLPGTTGLAEDVFINNFCFRAFGTGSTHGDIANAIEGALEEFYLTAPSSGSALHTFIGPQVSRTLPCIIKVYDLEQAPPREPLERTFTMGAGSTTGLPAELAVCLSYYAAENRPRRRGRIYFGPLGVTASEGSPSGGDVRVAAGLRTSLKNCASRLAAYAGGTVISWNLLSQVDASMHLITDGWVDNAFDVQRRRGVDATSRDTWS